MTAHFADDALRWVVYSDDPVLLLFGDVEEDLARGREAAARAGCHVADAAPIEGALNRLDRSQRSPRAPASSADGRGA